MLFDCIHQYDPAHILPLTFFYAIPLSTILITYLSFHVLPCKHTLRASLFLKNETLNFLNPPGTNVNALVTYVGLMWLKLRAPYYFFRFLFLPQLVNEVYLNQPYHTQLHFRIGPVLLPQEDDTVLIMVAIVYNCNRKAVNLH